MQRHECMPVRLDLSELKYLPVYLNKSYCGPFGEQRFHHHNFIEICYVVSGGGYHQIRDNVANCKIGDIYILNVGVAHAFFMSQDFSYKELLIKNLIFLPEFVYSNEHANSQLVDIYHHLFTEVLTDDTSVIKLSLNAQQLESIEQLYANIENEYNHMENGSLGIIKAEITIFLIKLARYIKQNADSVIPYRYNSCSLSVVEGACNFISANYSDSSITITSAAEHVYTGKSYLSRIFKKYTGKYFSDYLREYRMNEACRLLCSTTMTNEQISQACGFCDLPTFYTNFKRHTGTTPRQFFNDYIKNNPNRKANIMQIQHERSDGMNSTERVKNAILGLPTDRTPIYGWLSANLENQLIASYGSVAAFEDKYKFDAAHIFGGPGSFDGNIIKKINSSFDELTPDILVNEDFFTNPDSPADYNGVRDAIAFHKERGRFCYVQTPGFFENFNGIFGIENQLAYLAEYPDELAELYRRQSEWTIKFADQCIECGADMIHISDDWGAQNSLMFSPKMWLELIKPNIKRVVDHVHSRKCLVSLHSDGCIAPVVGEIADIGFDCIHPWQESANMPYSLWLDSYKDRFAILGGICVQTTLGFGHYERLESEIRRVFSLLKNKRWICCTTHFVQSHCSIEELTFAYNLIYNLSRE